MIRNAKSRTPRLRAALYWWQRVSCFKAPRQPQLFQVRRSVALLHGASPGFWKWAQKAVVSQHHIWLFSQRSQLPATKYEVRRAHNKVKYATLLSPKSIAWIGLHTSEKGFMSHTASERSACALQLLASGLYHEASLVAPIFLRFGRPSIHRLLRYPLLYPAQIWANEAEVSLILGLEWYRRGYLTSLWPIQPRWSSTPQGCKLRATVAWRGGFSSPRGFGTRLLSVILSCFLCLWDPSIVPKDRGQDIELVGLFFQLSLSTKSLYFITHGLLQNCSYNPPMRVGLVRLWLAYQWSQNPLKSTPDLQV